MKQVKKYFFLIGIWLIVASVTVSVNAAAGVDITPYWLNTELVALAHENFDGEAECAVNIEGLPGVTLIDNIDIVYYQEGFNDGEWIEIARWEDMYVAGDEFFWYDYVDNVYQGCVYRLTLSFDIHRNGIVEHIEDYLDRLYE